MSHERHPLATTLVDILTIHREVKEYRFCLRGLSTETCRSQGGLQPAQLRDLIDQLTAVGSWHSSLVSSTIFYDRNVSRQLVLSSAMDFVRCPGLYPVPSNPMKSTRPRGVVGKWASWHF